MPARAKLTTNEITQSTISVDNFAIGDEMSHAEMDSNFLNLRDQTFGIVGDDSTGIDVKAGDTIKFLGQGATSVAVIGNQVVISSTDTGGGGGGVTSMRFVGDDSTGVTIGDGETLKITGAQNISVIATQDTVTITGPDLTSFATASSSTAFTNKTGNISQWTNDSAYVTASSSTAFTNKTGNISQWTNNSGYLTNSTITIVGDDSTGTTLNTGETIKFAGAGGASVAVSGDTVTITAGGGASQPITFVGDDSTGTAVNPGETFKIAGAGAIETSVSGDQLLISLAESATALTLVGDDSTGSTLRFGDTVKVMGAGTVTTAVVNDVLTITGSGSGGSTGDLTFIGSTISSPSNAGITLQPSGAGSIVLDGLNWPTSDGTNGQILSTDGAGQLSFIANTASTGDLTITGSQILGPSNGDIDITPGGTGNLNLKTDTITLGETRGTQSVDTRIITKGITMITTNADDELNEPQIMLVEYNRGASGGGGGNINIKSGTDFYNSTRGRIELNSPTIKLGHTGTTSIEPGSNYDLQLKVQGTGRINIDAPTSTTIGANGAAAGLTGNPVGYIKIKVAGTEYQIPYYNV